MADTGRPIIPFALEDFLQDSTSGSIENAIGNNFYGINVRQQKTAIPINKDQYGFTFFVRPQLNMQMNNIRNLRAFSPLLTNNPHSYQMITKCLLDPRLIYGYNVDGDIQLNSGKGGNVPVLTCPFVDNLNAFIPLLTNNLLSISGFPDITSPTTTSKAGAYREEHTMVDGITAKYEAYDIEATFRNLKGDPIMALFYAWIHYQSAVFEGTLMPYPDFIVENTIDYTSRIYRIVLDPEKKLVQKIGVANVCFPTSLPLGAAFDFSTEKPYNDANSDITIRFACMGAEYQDDILVYEFNKTVQIFNPDMTEDAIEAGQAVKVTELYMNLFTNRVYPRINPDTYEFEWYVMRELFDNKMAAFAGLSNFKQGK
jgi:hypothetical protein